MIKVFISVIIFFCLSSCAKFSTDLLTENATDSTIGFHSLNGTYELIASQNYLPSDRVSRHKDEQSSKNLHYILTDQEKEFSADSIYKVEVKTRANKYISFKFMKGQKEIDFFVLKGKLKKNGFFYLDEEELNCIGIPYLIGGCYNCKTRIGISKDKGIIVNKAVSNRGALLFFLVSGDAYNLAFRFNRI